MIINLFSRNILIKEKLNPINYYDLANKIKTIN